MKSIEFLQEIEGAIFDLDGTIFDSSWVWDKVDINFLGKRGFDVPDDYVEAISPLGAERAAVYTIQRFGLDETPDKVVREWFDMAKKEYAVQVTCKPFAKEYIKHLYESGVKLAIATSSDRELFMATLEREEILDYFSHIVTVNEVERGKGYPDVYEKAAEKLKINPHKCVVFEDLFTGIFGAKMGEFHVVAVQDEKSAHSREKIKELADYYIESFQELL